jgi:cytochrome d ubiquinol oxidase subunit I
MEGIYQTQKAAPLTVFGWVDEKAEKVKGLKIPGLLSFLTYRNFETPIKGFDQIPPDERPPIGIVFQTYHLMIAMWGLMMLLTLMSLYFWKKKTLAKRKWVLWALVISVIFPQIANQTGWMTAEIGRQPWVVYGVLRTVHGVSSTIVSSQVVLSIFMFIVIYTLLFALFLFLLDRKIKHGPGEEGEMPEKDEEVVYRNFFKSSKGVKSHD